MRLYALVFTALLLAPLAAPVAAPVHRPAGDVLVFDNGVIVVAVPARRPFPAFWWWLKGHNETVYSAFYFGIAEAWIPPEAPFRHGLLFARGDFARQVVGRMRERGFGVEEDVLRGLRVLVAAAPAAALGNASELLRTVDEVLEKLDLLGKGEALPKATAKLKSALERLRDVLEEICEEGPSDEASSSLKEALREVRAAAREVMASLIAQARIVGEVMRKLALIRPMPFLVPFSALNWRFVGPKNITDSRGRVVGIAFSFVAESAKAPVFDRFEKIVIRCRLYAVNVTESVGNSTYVITRSELKNDIVIVGWRWGWDRLVRVLGRDAELVSRYLTPKLVLISYFTVGGPLGRVPAERIEAGESELIYAEASRVPGFRGRVIVAGKAFPTTVEAEESFTGEVVFLAENATVAGFYRFVPYAKVIRGNETGTVPVEGVFWITRRHLWVFLAYPYFNGATLEHDPSIGAVAAAEGTPQAAPSQQAPTPSLDSRIALAAAAALLTALLLLVSRRRL